MVRERHPGDPGVRGSSARFGAEGEELVNDERWIGSELKSGHGAEDMGEPGDADDEVG